MAALRLAAVLLVPFPTPMVTGSTEVRTEEVVLTWQVGKVEWGLLTGVRRGMFHLGIYPRVLIGIA
jgi:hypothetical protein